MATSMKELILSAQQDVNELRNHRNCPPNFDDEVIIDLKSRSNGHITWRKSGDKEATEEIWEMLQKQIESVDR